MTASCLLETIVFFVRSSDAVQANGALSGDQAVPTQTDPGLQGSPVPTQTDPGLQGSLEVQNMETSTKSAEEKDQEGRVFDYRVM